MLSGRISIYVHGDSLDAPSEFPLESALAVVVLSVVEVVELRLEIFID